VEMGRAERVTHARACSGDVAGRGRKRQADGRPGGQGRTVWAEWDGRGGLGGNGRQTAGRADRESGTDGLGGLGRPVCRTAGQAGGQPGARTAMRVDGRAGAAAG